MKRKNRILSLTLAASLLFNLIFLYNREVAASDTPPQMEWGALPIGGGGFVSGIVAGKNTMYLRTDVGGAYRYEDGKWVQMLGFVSEENKGYLSVESIAIDPNDDDKVYLLVGCSYFSDARTAIMKSTDGGRTFLTIDVSFHIRVHGNGDGRNNGERIAVDPTTGSVYAGGRTGYLIKGINEGLEWFKSGLENVMNATKNWPSWTSNSVKTTDNENGICSVVVGSNGHVYAAVSKTGEANIWRSTNGGTSWSILSTALPTNLFPQKLKFAPSGELLITYADKHGNNMGPQSGAIILYNITTNTVRDISITQNDIWGEGGTNKLAIGEVSYNPDNPQQMVAASSGMWSGLQTWSASGQDLWGDMIFKSTNGGASWTRVDLGNPWSSSPNYLRDGGVTWIPGKSLHWSSSIVVNPQNTNQILVTSGNGVFACDNIWAATPQVYFKPAGVEEVVALDFISVPGGKNYSAIGDYDGFVHSNLTDYPPVHSPSMGSTSGISYNIATNTIMRVAEYSQWGDAPTVKAYYSTNAGTSWTAMANLPNGAYGGKCAVAQDYRGEETSNEIFFWSPVNGSSSYYSDSYGNYWTACPGLPNNVYIYAEGGTVYAAGNGSFYVCDTYGGDLSFQKKSMPDIIGDGPVRFAAEPTGVNTGKVYIPGKDGLYVSSDRGSNFTKVAGITSVSAVGIGKNKPGSSSWSVYIWGKVGAGATGIYRSTDDCATWVRINDDQHQYGGPGNGNFIVGDMNVYGRLYMSTVGMGIIYGDLITDGDDVHPSDCTLHNCTISPCNRPCELHVCAAPACNRTCDLHNCTISPCNRPCELHVCIDPACNRICDLQYCTIPPCDRPEPMKDLYISEISREADTGDNEWVEITNPNTNVSLSTKGLFISIDTPPDNPDDEPYIWQMPSLIVRPGQSVLIRMDSGGSGELKRADIISFDFKQTGTGIGNAVYLTDAAGNEIFKFEILSKFDI
ncbi:MAG: lamin tail domain-containing protein [Oscillospiraceae bacterium]|nr:lamin tail domain-containing protein [Oscillospiraceae bacterium]